MRWRTPLCTYVKRIFQINTFSIYLFNSINRHGNLYLGINGSLAKFVSRFQFLKFVLFQGYYFTILKVIYMAVFMPIDILLRNNVLRERIWLIQETPADQPTNQRKRNLKGDNDRIRSKSELNYLPFLFRCYFIDWDSRTWIAVVRHRGWLPMSLGTIQYIYMTASHNWFVSTYSHQLMPLQNGPFVRFFPVLVAWDSSATVCYFTFFGKSQKEAQFKEAVLWKILICM